MTAEEALRLRQEAMEKITLTWDPSYPEVTVEYDGSPIVMIRSKSLGTRVWDEDFVGFLSDMNACPEQGRFALYSWDNDDSGGDWTGNIDGRPLWESSLTWPPEEDYVIVRKTES